MRWLRFILSHSIFISFCASALGAQAFILYREQINFSACILLFFLTLGSYNLYWILSKLSFGRRSVILKGSYANIFLGLISVVGAAFILWEHPSFVPHLVIPVTLTIAYSLPLWPGKIFENLRKAGFMKTILLALAWSWNTIFLPLQVQVHESDSELLILFGARFFFMLMLCLIFDSRDARVDKIRSLSSLATQLTPLQLSWFFSITFLLFMCMGFLFRIMNGETFQLFAFAVAGIVTWITYRLSLKPRGYFFYYFFVDGLMLFSAVATIIASIL